MGPAELQLYKMSGFSHTEESGAGWSGEELTGVGRYRQAIVFTESLPHARP